MINKSHKFKYSAIALGVASCFAAAPLVAQEQPDAGDDVEIINVTGVRGSQIKSINVKRGADSVVDAISSEDIGKLPDATISDSLQRISGIQIRRSAGEGGSVNIRGLPQVLTQMNGEQYQGANSVVSSQPDFGDVPAPLFRGVEVHKSPTASLGNAGITGTINLQTYRPFDFDTGLTTAGSIEARYGMETESTDPAVNALVNWNDEKVGFLLALAYSDVTLSNSYNGFNTSAVGEVGWTGQFADTWIGEEDQGRWYMGAQGFAAWNQETERERLGVNASLQIDLGEGFVFTSDIFYTDQDEYNRKVGMSATDKWQSWNWFTPTSERATGAEHNGGEFYSWQTIDMNPKRVKSFTQNDSYLADSTNMNFQLDYDNGGNFTGNFRGIVGRANRDKRHGYNEGDLTNGTSTLGRTTNFLPSDKCEAGDEVVGDMGGCNQEINPLGYGENPQLSLDTNGSHPTWSGFDNEISGGLGDGATLADYMSNLGSYNIGAFSSENNENSEADLKAFSLNGSYSFDRGFITSVDMGARLSTREVDFERFHLFSPFHNAGCEAQWKATDVLLNADGACQDGEMVNGEFVPYVVLESVALDEYNNVTYITDFGPVSGIPGMWAVNPKDYDNPEAFHNKVFGSTRKQIVPGRSFAVDLDETSYYVQGNFEFLDGDLTGNVGMRMVETDLSVKQNIAGAGIAYGNSNEDAGDILTKRSYNDYLPSLNMAYELSEDLILRVAFSKNMIPLDLNQWGDGLSISYALDSNEDSETYGQFIATSGTSDGNPELDPWRSDNYDLSLEYYIGEASMLNAAIFKVDIDSFTQNETIQQEVPDADGVVRRSVPVTTNVQGEGGTLEGIELGAKMAMSDLLGDNNMFSDFGFDSNFTYSPSEQESRDIYGDKNMFPDNSERQFNLIGWYQADKFQARVAYNYRSKRLAATGGAWGALNLYQDSIAYVDVSASYDIYDNLTVYMSGSNVTEEYEDYYMEFKDQFAYQNYYEARYTIGIRGKY
ncbi:TonB-dependent receptor [Neiella marina]|uniref:TonB-dependent receptor n=1 Tax=Neiella holothuriorum TaxID=2870530 RepID=A0ABS7EIR1_9GAMM|nr:TonB-dependent receptor [Neiella holothuriorum]MBW8192110.1 TonB-dependent receptor [Neiella holothuriorum]